MRASNLPFLCHAFEGACADLNVEHRLTKALPSKVEGPQHPWTNGQVEWMNRTIKEATVKRYHYETHDQLRQHLIDFVAAYNFARRLKTLRGLTPYEAICKARTDDPSRFISNLHHQSPRPNIWQPATASSLAGGMTFFPPVCTALSPRGPQCSVDALAVGITFHFRKSSEHVE